MKPKHLLLTRSVIAALPVMLFATRAHAQYRIDTGRVNDANNRVGSGGYNSPSEVQSPALGTSVPNSNTNVLTGNTTGLSYFHGVSQVFDPNVVQTRTGTQNFDAFNAISAPVNYAQRSNGQSQYQPFYSTATYNQAPPPGTFAKTPNNVGLVPTQNVAQQPSDSRLGVINVENTQSLLPPPGELDLPGGVDTNGNRTLTTLSPLYGVRDWRSSDSSDQYFLSHYSNVPADSFNPLDRPTNQSSNTANPADQGSSNTGNSSTPGQPAAPGTNVGGNGVQTGGANNASGASIGNKPVTGSVAVNGQVQSQPLDRMVGSQSVNGGLTTDQGVTQRVVDLPPPSQQSSQIADLEQRLDAQGHQQMSPSEAGDNYNQQLALKKRIADEQAAKAGANAPGGTPGQAPGNSPAAPGAKPIGGYGAFSTTPGYTTPAPRPATLPPIVTTPASSSTASQRPLVITSLATGLASPQLTATMRSAEEMLRSGKFNDALDQYDAAARLAPNNPFTYLGRSFAELGASYYSRSNGDLRRVIVAEPALLAGRYDLRGFLGEDRLQFVTKDLQDILGTEHSNSTAALLLAFIQHNNGDDKAAAGLLNTATQREGGQPDGVLNLMRKVWNLPPAS